MVAAVRVHKPGGPEALTYEDVQIAAPGQGQIKIKQHACGVNFIDAYFRMGMYPSPVGLPFIAGNESAGEVMAVGPGVTDVKVGDRVAFVGPLGGYAGERLVPADRAVKLPSNISYEQAAGMMLKGMTVQYLLNRTYKVEKGTVCLIHAAAGGVGLIACQWANHLGATVIGTVGTKEKAELAKKNGCHHTILYRDEDFVAKVKEITSGKLCDVVYDGIGKTTFPASLDCLRPLGYFVSFGSASGQIEAFNINILQTKARFSQPGRRSTITSPSATIWSRPRPTFSRWSAPEQSRSRSTRNIRSRTRPRRTRKWKAATRPAQPS
jgi:NADPH2:quinone reductase